MPPVIIRRASPSHRKRALFPTSLATGAAGTDGPGGAGVSEPTRSPGLSSVFFAWCFFALFLTAGATASLVGSDSVGVVTLLGAGPPPCGEVGLAPEPVGTLSTYSPGAGEFSGVVSVGVGGGGGGGAGSGSGSGVGAGSVCAGDGLSGVVVVCV